MTKPSNSEPTPFRRIGVVGAGTMGAGIAQLAAQSGYEIILYDLQTDWLEAAKKRMTASLQTGIDKGKLPANTLRQVETRLSLTTELERFAEVDLVIEAIPEDLALKRELFARLDSLTPPHAVLASNTSSLSITALGGATQRPAQVAGLHFFNPVPLMKLVEVIQGQRTSEETVTRLLAFSESLGKTPVRAQDTPGFIVNRVARPFYGEALKLLGEHGGAQNEAMIRLIDTVMKDVGGFRMGPFELMDLIGIDVNFAVTQSVYNATFQEPRYRPHPIQQRKVEAGLLGRKTGEGFYRYD